MAMISVCIPTYNGERYLHEQLASILRSPLVDEVLVSDDGSSDGTRGVVERLNDPRLLLIDGPRTGLVDNYEHLLRRASGDRIFLADQDDVWMPDKVEVMSKALETADLVLSDCVVVDGALNELQPSFFSSRGSRPGLLRNLARNSYLGCCMAFDRKLLAHALPFPKRLPMHDWWLGLVAETFGSVCFLPRPLIKYRRHGNNASATSESSSAGFGTQLAWRLRIAAGLTARWIESKRAGEGTGKTTPQG